MGEPTLGQAEIDHIVTAVPMKLAGPVEWFVRGLFLEARVTVVAPGVAAKLVLDLTVNSVLPGKYTFQLRQVPAVQMRRLDVRASHTNPDGERWQGVTHKHRWRDAHGTAYAYTPSDIPDTSSPVSSPNVGEHEAVFKAFCAECNIDPGEAWQDPPTTGLDVAE